MVTSSQVNKSREIKISESKIEHVVKSLHLEKIINCNK